MRRIAVMGLAVGFALCAVQSAQAKTVKLAYKYKQGEVDKYKVTVDFKMTMPGGTGAMPGPMSRKSSAIMTRKVLKVLPNGSAQVQLSFRELTPSGKVAPESPSRSSDDVTVTMSKYGEVADAAGMGGLGGAMGMGANPVQMMVSCPLPARALSVGQSYKESTALPSGIGQTKTVSTLVGAAVPYGKETASEIKQTTTGRVDIAKAMKAFGGSGGQPGGGVASGISGTTNIKGLTVIFFSPTSGKLLKSTRKITATSTMSRSAALQQQGAPAKAKSTTEINVTVTKL